MRGIGRSRLQRRHDQGFDPVVTDHPGAPRTRLVEQALEPVCDEPCPPLSGTRDMDVEFVRNRGIAEAVSSCQHDPRDRIARAFALLDRRDHDTNSQRSSSVRFTTDATGFDTP